MVNDIIKYLSKHVNLNEDEINTFLKLNLIRKYKKGSILLKEGEFSKECFLVLSGCIRNYYLINGEEKTTDFFTENQPITPISYTTKTPSEYYISCLEDSVVSVGNPEKSKILLKKIPKFAALSNIINNERLVEKQMIFDDYINLNPEQRYLKLLETRPNLINRIPQYMIASYLGIKPESLSRIRKRLTGKKKKN